MSTSYKSIFKTSLLTGGSQVIVMLFNMVRAKALALLLGPAGTGIIGLYNSVTQLVNSIANIGLPSSAVRQIAAANVSDDRKSIGKTLFVFRTLIRITTVIAGLVMLLFARQISELSFGEADYTNGIRWMSLVVFFTGISNGQFTLLQGLRRIKDLALARIIGAILGTAISILLIWIFKENGIIPFLIAGSAATILISWLFAHRVKIPAIPVKLNEFKPEATKLLSMGLAFLVSGLVISITGYYSRVLITKQFSLTELGLFTASWTLSAIYVNFVLSAMGTDFYPRITEVINDHALANKIVNEQTDMGITLALPGIVTVVGFSGLFLRVFYSAKFIDAAPLLQWMTVGMVIKVVSWPMGYIIISKGKSLLFASTEILWGVLFIPLLFLLIKYFGLQGAGVAFGITYLLHTIVIWIAGKKLSGFTWDKQSIIQILILVLSVTVVFSSTRYLNDIWSVIVNSFIVICLLFYTYFHLEKKLGGRLLTKLLARLGWEK